MLYELKGSKVVREHYPLNDDIPSSTRVRAFCGYANYYGERIERLLNEINYCFGKFEDEYKQSPRGGSSKLSPECERWDSGAKDAIEWLMRAIADDELDKKKRVHGKDIKKTYLVETNRRHFEFVVDMLQRVPFDMMKTIEFLTLALWLCWVDETDDTEANRMFGVIIGFWDDKKDAHRYHRQFVPALLRALYHLGGKTITKVEFAYTAFAEKCGQYTGGDNRPIIDALGGAWIRMTDPTVFVGQIGAMPLLRKGSSAAFAYIGQYVAPQLGHLDEKLQALADQLGWDNAQIVEYSKDLREVTIRLVRRFNLGAKPVSEARQDAICTEQANDAERITREWRKLNDLPAEFMIHIEVNIMNLSTKLETRRVTV